MLFCSLGGLSAPNLCTAGAFCPNASFQLPCTVGGWCATGVTVATPCALGNWCAAGSSVDATACPAGSVCSTPASKMACASGYHFCVFWQTQAAAVNFLSISQATIVLPAQRSTKLHALPVSSVPLPQLKSCALVLIVDVESIFQSFW